jgi:hypothetical protein
MTAPAIYLPQDQYDALVAEVIENFELVDLLERAVLDLCAANIWPEGVRPADDAH